MTRFTVRRAWGFHRSGSSITWFPQFPPPAFPCLNYALPLKATEVIDKESRGRGFRPLLVYRIRGKGDYCTWMVLPSGSNVPRIVTFLPSCGFTRSW
jgi:hypothetical protein